MLDADLSRFLCTYMSDMRSNPDKVIVVDSMDRRKVTSGQFVKMMDSYVHLMSSKGVRQGDVVAIRLDRKAEQIAAILSCLSYGCVYVLINPDHPMERVSKIYGSCVPVITMDDSFVNEAESLEGVLEHVPNEIPDDEPGMIYYTSGTTGEPKGILHSRALALRGIRFFSRQVPSDDRGNVLSIIDSMFVLSIGEWMLSVALGMPMHIVDRSIVTDIDALRGYITDRHITHAFMTPTLLKAIGNGTSLSVALIGGEKSGSLSALKGIHIINLIGATECPLVAFGHVADTDAEVTIDSAPNEDSRVFLSEGDRGEILLRTKRTMIRYIDSDGTDGKYVDEPDTGFSLFHTGDFGKMTDNGIVVIGRMDSMVKINGQRVEPAETEYAMSRIDGVDEAVVKAFDDDGRTYLCGYYSSSTGLSEPRVREALGDMLPGYMIPSFISRLEVFPRNQSGKIDRASLETLKGMSSSQAPPENDVQRILCDAFSKALNIGPVGIDDDFIGMGGNSYDAMRMAALCKESDIRLDPNVILRERTVRDMSLLLEVDEHEPFIGPLGDIRALAGPYLLACDTDHLRQDCRILLDSSKDVSAELLQRAVDIVTDRHDMLRSIHEGDHIVRPVGTSVCHVSEVECDTSSLRSLMDDVCSSVSADRGDAMSCSVIHDTTVGTDRILIAVDPLVADRTSLGIVVRDMIAVYSALSSGSDAPKLHRSGSFKSWMGAVEGYVASDTVSGYWHSVHDVVVSSGCGAVSVRKDVSDAYGPGRIRLPQTPYGFDDRTMALTVLIMAYNRSTGRDTIVLRMCGSGRSIADVDRTVGQFSNHHPLVLRMKESTVSTVYGVLRSLLGTPEGGIGYSLLGHHEQPNGSFEERWIDVPDSDGISVSDLSGRVAFSMSVDGSVSLDLIGSDGTYDVYCTDGTFGDTFVSCASELDGALVNGHVFEYPCTDFITSDVITTPMIIKRDVPLSQHMSGERIRSIVGSFLDAHPILRGRLIQRDGTNWVITDLSLDDVCLDGDELPNGLDFNEGFIRFLAPCDGGDSISYVVNHMAYDILSFPVFETDLRTIANGGTVQTETGMLDHVRLVDKQNSMDMREEATRYYGERASNYLESSTYTLTRTNLSLTKDIVEYDPDTVDSFIKCLGISKASYFMGAAAFAFMKVIGEDTAPINYTYNVRLAGIPRGSIGPLICDIVAYVDIDRPLVRDYLLDVHNGLLAASKYYGVCDRPEVSGLGPKRPVLDLNYVFIEDGKGFFPRDGSFCRDVIYRSMVIKPSLIIFHDFGSYCQLMATLPLDVETSKRVVSEMMSAITRMPIVQTMDEACRS